VPVELTPITDGDVAEVAAFMHANLNQKVPVAAWARAMRTSWTREAAPNHGFMLRADGQVVGAYLAYYSDRIVDGQSLRFCNLGAWCVLESHRFQGLRLLTTLLAQPDYHFTDFSPSGNVIALNRRLKFSELDTTTAVLPNLPWPPGRGVRVHSSTSALLERLGGADLQYYQHHRSTAATRHLLLTVGDEQCYVAVRRDSRKGVRVFASLLYVGNPDLLRNHWRHLGHHLLTRHAVPATLVELRFAGRPAGSYLAPSSRPRMFRSPTLKAEQVDYLYSELACLAW
jgi:hypothetical protein